MVQKRGTECNLSISLGNVHRLMRQNDYNSAIGEMLVRGRFRLKSKYSPVSHDAWYAVGDCYSKLGLYGRALRSFENAYRAKPADRDTLFAIANCYSDARDPEFAVVYFGYLCAINEDDAEARYNLGNAYMDAGEFGLALKNFKKIKSKDERLLKLAAINAAKAENSLAQNSGQK